MPKRRTGGHFRLQANQAAKDRQPYRPVCDYQFDPAAPQDGPLSDGPHMTFPLQREFIDCTELFEIRLDLPRFRS